MPSNSGWPTGMTIPLPSSGTLPPLTSSPRCAGDALHWPNLIHRRTTSQTIASAPLECRGRDPLLRLRFLDSGLHSCRRSHLGDSWLLLRAPKVEAIGVDRDGPRPQAG